MGAPGWLPGPLVEEASRAAVALLDLDADSADSAEGGAGGGGPAPAGAGGAAAPEAASGPVPFTAGSYTPVGAGFGAPDPSYGGAAGPYAPYAPYAPPGSPGARPGTAGPYGTAPTGGSGQAAGPYTSTPTGGSGPAAGPYGSPTETAGSGLPGQRTPSDGRQVTVRAAGRRFSCTVVLAAAAVLAVLSGGIYFLDLLPGQGGDQRDLADAGAHPSVSASAPAPAATPSSAPTGSGSAAPKGTRTDVPKELIGTWKGTVTTAHTRLATEFEITIKAGKVGDVVARDKSVVPVLGTDCSGDWRLAAATDRSLVLDTSAGPNPAPGMCSNGSADERFTLNENGTLHYKSADAPAGNPEGDLTRSP